MPNPNDIKFALTYYVVRVFGGPNGMMGNRVVVETHGKAAHNAEGHNPPIIDKDAKEIMVGCLFFHDTGATIPQNTLSYTEGAQMHYPISALSAVLKLLKEAERLWIAFSPDVQTAYLFTWD